MPTRQEVIDYITKSALARGIDPNIALRVFKQESQFNPAARNITPREESYGVTQLNVKGGLGAEARRRGIEPSDPSQWQKHVDFSLDTVRKDGWRQWGGARDTGVARWQGINESAPTSPKGGKIQISETPQLKDLTPTPQPLKPLKPLMGDETRTSVLSQMAPTEERGMARPSMNDAIRQAMDEAGIRDYVRYAGFVPPGLTKGAAATRDAANRGVRPRGTIKDAEAEARRAEELRNVPNADKQMEGSYADYVRKQKEKIEAEQNQPGGRKIGGPDVAVPREPGTSVVPADPTLAAQNDPARQALIAAKITGRVDPNSGGPVPRTSSTTPAGRAATAAGATALGVASTDTDPAVKAVQDKIAQSGGAQAAPGGGGPTANVDPATAKWIAQQEQAAGLPPGTLIQGGGTMALGPMIGQALPAFQEAMKDPATAQAAQTVAKSVVSAKARRDAMRSDMQNDPTYYQKLAAAGQMPGGQQDDRAMERAVMMDNQRAMQMRGRSTPQPTPVPPQSVPQTTRGTVRVRQTPPEMRSTEQQIVDQAIPPGAEKGDVPPQPVSPRYTAAMAYPPGVTPTQGAYDPSGGIPQGVPSAGQMPMDPAMMQLMQFFMGGGGGGTTGE